VADDQAVDGKLFSLKAYKMGEKTALNFDLPYDYYEDALANMAFFVWNFSSNLPRDPLSAEAQAAAGPASGPAEDWAWKNKWLYLGLQATIVPGNYSTTMPLSGMSLMVGLRMEIQFLHWYWPYNYLSFSLAAGTDGALDMVSYYTYDTSGAITSIPENATAISLTAPLLFRVNFKPGRFLFSLSGGIYYMLPLIPEIFILPPSYAAGFKAGIKAGPGVLYLDACYAGPIDLSTIPGDSVLHYQRRMALSLTLGYEFGVFSRPVK
jgi:hypothetical protein